MDFSNKNIWILIAIILLMVVGFGLVIKWNLKENTVEISSAESNSKKSTIEANQSTNPTPQNLKTIRLLIICNDCDSKKIIGKKVHLTVGSSKFISLVDNKYSVIFSNVPTAKGNDISIYSKELNINENKPVSDLVTEGINTLFYGNISITKNDLSEIQKNDKNEVFNSSLYSSTPTILRRNLKISLKSSCNNCYFIVNSLNGDKKRVELEKKITINEQFVITDIELHNTAGLVTTQLIPNYKFDIYDFTFEF